MNNYILELLNSRGITIQKVSSLVALLKGEEEDTKDHYENLVLQVIDVKEIKDFIALGITLDIYSESNLLPESLDFMMSGEDPTFTLIDTIAIALLNQFGSDAVIHYGYLTKRYKDKIEDPQLKHSSNIFLSKILGMIVAAASSDVFQHTLTQSDPKI